MSDALSSAELQAARPERAPNPRASAWTRLQGWSGTTPPGAGEMGRPGSRGRPCLTPPPNVPPTSSQIRRHSINPCLKCAFQNTRSHSPSGHRRPTWGPGWSQQQVRDRPHQILLAPTWKRGRTHTPGTLSVGGPRSKGMGRGGPPWRSLGAGHQDHMEGVSPAPRRLPLHPRPPSSVLPGAPPC